MKEILRVVMLVWLGALVIKGCGNESEKCNPEARTVCFEGTYYWVDSCNVRGEKITDCECGCNADLTGCKDPCCVPSCAEKECGPDGCGGTCQPGCNDIEGCDEDTGQCVEIACRDVQASCSKHEICCGWPKDGYQCPDGVNLGECYFISKDIWCQPCVGKQLGDPCEVAGYGHGEQGICMMDRNTYELYCQIACRDDLDCPSGWNCIYSSVQDCSQPTDCEATAVCDYFFRYYDEQGNLTELDSCYCQTDSDCPVDIDGFEVSCQPRTACDNTVDPPDCNEVYMCSYARSCQCVDCCSTL